MRLIHSVMFSLLLGAATIPVITLAASAQIVITVGVPPPPLPVYDQPDIPAPGYFWTPGYWAYDDYYGYYWVPGTWVEPPESGLLWTPGYWGYDNGNYVYFDGYWADQVGYYGGVDYGYGYTGSGYYGGYWQGDDFFYNRALNNITNVNIVNVYSKTVIIDANPNRVSYNGGEGGLTLRPTERQVAFAHQQHIQATSLQREHVQMASHDPSLREARNHGRPPIAATSRPNEFKGHGVVRAKTAGVRPSGQVIPHGKGSGGETGPGGHEPHGSNGANGAPAGGATPEGATPTGHEPHEKKEVTPEGGTPPAGHEPHEKKEVTPAGGASPGGHKPHDEGAGGKPPEPQEHRAEPRPAPHPQVEQHNAEPQHPMMMVPHPQAPPHPQIEEHHAEPQRSMMMAPHPQAPPHPQGQPRPHPEGKPEHP